MNIAWFAMLIPILTGIVFYLLYKKKIVWWEIILPVGICFLLILLTNLIANKVQVTDTEYWGGWLTQATYYEEWNEEVTETETYTDSKGKTHTRTVTRTEDHPAKWEAQDSNGEEVEITQDFFEQLCELWKSREFVDMNRNYDTKDGDAYVATYDGTREHVIPTTKMHRWENKVQCSKSIFNFPEVKDPKKYGLYDYPEEDFFNSPAVLPTGMYEGEDALQEMNSVLGAQCKFRLWVLIYKNKSDLSAAKQEAYWKRGNKNELVVCIGVNDKQEIQWVNVFSWTRKQELPIEVRNYLLDQKKLNLKAFADWLEPEVVKKWEKRNFHEFDYLQVEPPTWAIILIYILVFIVSVVCGLWSAYNDFTEDGSERRNFYSRYYRGRMRW